MFTYVLFSVKHSLSGNKKVQNCSFWELNLKILFLWFFLPWATFMVISFMLWVKTKKNCHWNFCSGPSNLDVTLTPHNAYHCNGDKFWISCQRLRILRKASHSQLIQNSTLFTIVWSQCEFKTQIESHPNGCQYPLINYLGGGDLEGSDKVGDFSSKLLSEVSGSDMTSWSSCCWSISFECLIRKWNLSAPLVLNVSGTA